MLLIFLILSVTALIIVIFAKGTLNPTRKVQNINHFNGYGNVSRTTLRNMGTDTAFLRGPSDGALGGKVCRTL